MSTTYLKLGLAILFLVCLFNMPYGYYQLVRFLGMVGFAVLAYQNYQKNQTWFLVWLASALLINPFIKVSLGRSLWNVADVVWAILLVWSIFEERRQVTSVS